MSTATTATNVISVYLAAYCMGEETPSTWASRIVGSGQTKPVELTGLKDGMSDARIRLVGLNTTLRRIGRAERVRIVCADRNFVEKTSTKATKLIPKVRARTDMLNAAPYMDSVDALATQLVRLNGTVEFPRDESDRKHCKELLAVARLKQEWELHNNPLI